ncbi:MAG: hypothetical protein ACLVAT_10775 [Lachnospiraceae bacterium]
MFITNMAEVFFRRKITAVKEPSESWRRNIRIITAIRQLSVGEIRRRTIRLYVETQLLNQLLGCTDNCCLDHNLGGGATEYLIEKRKLALKEGKRFLTVRFDIDNMRYYLEYEYKNIRFSILLKIWRYP